MSLYLTKIPSIFPKVFKNITWHGDRSKNEIFLTFDDGPDPNSTPWILDTLSEFGVKATFFCLGQNVEKYPNLFQRIKDEGHQVGNHTYSHLSGWTTAGDKYIEDIQKADKLIQSKLFRPPYGRISPKQIKILSRDFKIVMWDVMSGDFDMNLSPEKVVNNVIQNVQNGSIIVMHERGNSHHLINSLLSVNNTLSSYNFELL